MPPDHRADRVHDGSAMKPATPSNDHHGVACVTARFPLGARRHQVGLAAGQRAGAADLGRRTARSETIMFRDGFHRGLGEQRLDRARGRAAGAAQERARARRHPLRPAPRAAVRGSAASPTTCARSPRPGARGRRDLLSSATKEVLASPRSTTSRSATARCTASPGPVYAALSRPYQRAKGAV